MKTEEQKPNNPSAFPVTNSERLVWEPGMTLRDYFAGLAMQGILSGNEIARTGNKTPISISEWSYRLADAMLNTRETK